MWGIGFLASLQCNMWPCATKKKPKNSQEKTSKQKPAKITLAMVMATKSPKTQPSLCLRRSPVPDVWLLKCQRYLHHCADGEEGLRRANSLLCCNSDLTLWWPWPALHPSVLLTSCNTIFSFLLFCMYSNEILSNSWLDDGTISDALVRCQVQYTPGLSERAP